MTTDVEHRPMDALRSDLRRALRHSSAEHLQRALRLALLEMEAGLVERRMTAPGLPQREWLEQQWRDRPAGRA